MSKDKAGLATRKAAVKLLANVLQDKRPLDEAIGRYGTSGPLQDLLPKDRAFARAIVSTALRRKGQLDEIISRFLEKPLPKKCGNLKEILLCGAAQMIFMDTPPHAAIDLAVRHCKGERRSFRFSSLANAVLRRISEYGKSMAENQDYVRVNTPEWLWNRWEKTYGTEQTELIAHSHMQEAALDLTVKSNPEGWAEKLGGYPLPNGSVRILHKGRIEQIEGYDDGEWWVQDIAAALCAPLLGHVQGLQVADLCAAPGGKTAQLANAGAHVTAVDISAKRLDRLAENMIRLGLRAEIVESDVTIWQPREQFDAVLVDAPCSATGTIRRHPDLPHLKSEADILELASLQERVLENSLNIVKRGGVIVYCTCSLEPEEGIDQIARFLERHPNVRLEPVRPAEVSDYNEWIYEGCIRSLPSGLPAEDPQYAGMDGFFAARMRVS